MNKPNKPITLVIAAIVGIAIGAVVTITVLLLSPTAHNNHDGMSSESSDENKPLYWVAPMDPNFKRDKPGKSPMGMDLVPVYAEADREDSPGTISVAPNVINSLGVRTEQMVLKPLDNSIQTVGYVQYDEDRLIHIHPRVEGWLEKLYIKAEGEQVRKGQPLYKIYSPALVNAQEEFLLALNRNNKTLINAATERMRALQIPENYISDLKKTKQVKQHVTVYAETDGVVDNLKIREGFYVQPGTTLMSIGNLEQVWVNAEVYERQAMQVHVGDKVTMTLGYLPGQSWQGHVDYIYPTLDASTRTVRVRMRFENPDFKLKPNMFAQVIIESRITDNSLVIPREALIRTGSMNKVVLALGEGRFKSIEVKTGHSTDKYVEVLEGLTEQDSIVVSAQFLLDSESSISSDFKRMNHDEEASDEELKSASVNGVINHIDLENDIFNISRDAIEKWNRDAATMDFILSAELKAMHGDHLKHFKVGDTIHFTFVITDDFDFVITEMSIAMNDQQHQHMHH